MSVYFSSLNGVFLVVLASIIHRLGVYYMNWWRNRKRNWFLFVVVYRFLHRNNVSPWAYCHIHQICLPFSSANGTNEEEHGYKISLWPLLRSMAFLKALDPTTEAKRQTMHTQAQMWNKNPRSRWEEQQRELWKKLNRKWNRELKYVNV